MEKIIKIIIFTYLLACMCLVNKNNYTILTKTSIFESLLFFGAAIYEK